jgi:hypothetical protein
VNVGRSVNGAVAGAAAAAVWAAQQPLDKRAFGTRYDDVELLGKAVTRGSWWPAAGLAMHGLNGALFGAAYAHLKPFLPGPVAGRGAVAALAEHVALWPLVAVTDRLHPAREELETLSGNRRAWAQAAWRHALFGVVLALAEHRLNRGRHEEPPEEIPVSSNGHGDIERAVATPVAGA